MHIPLKSKHKGIVITFATIKGGTGRTTSVAAVADVLAHRWGNRVLLIDADPRAPHIRACFGPYLFRTLLPRSQDAIHAENDSAPVTAKFPNGKLAHKYAQLTTEIVERIERQPHPLA